MDEKVESELKWLKRFAGKLHKSGDLKTAETGKRMSEAIEAIENELKGIDVEAMGSKRVARLLAPGKQVRLFLVSGSQIGATIVTPGRYDVLVLTADGRSLLVPKHSVLFYEFLPEPERTVEEDPGERIV